MEKEGEGYYFSKEWLKEKIDIIGIYLIEKENMIKEAIEESIWLREFVEKVKKKIEEKTQPRKTWGWPGKYDKPEVVVGESFLKVLKENDNNYGYGSNKGEMLLNRIEKCGLPFLLHDNYLNVLKELLKSSREELYIPKTLLGELVFMEKNPDKIFTGKRHMDEYKKWKEELIKEAENV